jgi:hypothetical protein
MQALQEAQKMLETDAIKAAYVIRFRRGSKLTVA